MKILITLWLFISATSSSFAQFTVVNLFQWMDADTTSEQSISFPLLSSDKHPDIAKKLNAELQQRELGAPYKQGVNPFEGGSVGDYTCSVVANSERIASFDITYGYCGCGCHYTFKNHSFDARTGDDITEAKLFTQIGISRLRQYMLEDFRKKIKQFAIDAPEYFKEEYLACPDLYKDKKEMPIDRWVVRERGVSFWGGGCLDGSSWQQDAARMEWNLPFDQIWPALTPYGLNLFTGESSGPASVINTVLHGSVDGKYPISVVLLKANHESFYGYIAYNKYGQSIKLDVKFDEGRVIMHELDNDGKALSDIETVWDGTTLRGTFKSLRNGKVMPFVASK
jgi:hypothetical protein